jgi:hypothetical protein
MSLTAAPFEMPASLASEIRTKSTVYLIAASLNPA